MGLIVLRRDRESCAYPRLVPVVVGIAVGGALGALARYGLDEWIGRRTGAFPWGILVVNVTGAFLIGLAVETLEPRFETGWVRPAVVTGFLGAYTTFSTLSLDTFRLLERGELGQAVANMARDGRARDACRLGGDHGRPALTQPARARASSTITSASARLPKPRVSTFSSSRSL